MSRERASLLELEIQTSRRKRPAPNFQHQQTAISGTSTTTLFPSTLSSPLHHPPFHSSIPLPPSDSADMADMDTYDNEPRTYDGMSYTYTPYANRCIRSYGDLFDSNISSSDPWSRASEGDFNIYPHSRQSWHATPSCPTIY